MLDLFNREVVGWSLKPRMTAEYIEVFYAPKEVPLGDNRKRLHSTPWLQVVGPVPE